MVNKQNFRDNLNHFLLFPTYIWKTLRICNFDQSPKVTEFNVSSVNRTYAIKLSKSNDIVVSLAFARGYKGFSVICLEYEIGE